MKRPVIWPNQFLKDESGGVLILVAVLIVVLLGVSALAVDAGALYQARREMVNAADSAALAGAQQLHRNLTGIDNDPAKEYAENFATNYYDCDQAMATVNNLEVEVIAEKNVELFFARFLGIDDVDVSSRAVAKIGKLTEGNIMPFGMSLRLFDEIQNGPQHTFVEFDHEYGPGNWGWVSFDTKNPDNAHTTINYLDSGADAYIGMPVETNPGKNVVNVDKNRVKAILDGYIGDPENGIAPAELWVPITGNMKNGRDDSEIFGFAVIILEGYTLNNSESQIERISGRIISGVFDAEALDTQGDYSIYYPSGVALIQ